MTKLEEKYLEASKELTKLAIGKAITVCIKEGNRGFVQLHAYKERLIDVVDKERKTQINHHLWIQKCNNHFNEWTDFDRFELQKWMEATTIKIDETIKTLEKSFSNIDVMGIELNNYRVAE